MQMRIYFKNGMIWNLNIFFRNVFNFAVKFAAFMGLIILSGIEW